MKKGKYLLLTVTTAALLVAIPFRFQIARISSIWVTATDRQEPTVSTMSCTNLAAMRNTAVRSRSLSKDLRRPAHRKNVRLDTGIRKISAAEPQVS